MSSPDPFGVFELCGRPKDGSLMTSRLICDAPPPMACGKGVEEAARPEAGVDRFGFADVNSLFLHAGEGDGEFVDAANNSSRSAWN
jgi:hypothetical protein